MKNYQILEETGIKSLIDSVEKWMSFGWVCQGGVHVRSQGFKDIYTQAMVKE